MKRILISMMLLMAMTAAYAQTESDEMTSEINQIVELSNISNNFMETLVTQMQPLVEQGYVSADDLPALIMDIEAFASPLMKKKMAELYKANFTLEELKQIHAYLSSPAGRKATKLIPEFTMEGMKIMQTPEAQKKIQEIAAKYLNRSK